MQLLASDDSIERPEVFRSASKAMSLVRDHISDLQLTSFMPSHMKPLLENVFNELTKADEHLQRIDGIASKYYGVFDETTEGSTQRFLNQEDLSKSLKPKVKGLSKADYHHRAKNLHKWQQYGVGNHHVDHQQGYRRARASRQAGDTRRRLSTEGTSETACVDVDPRVQKTEQCLRLALCANNYGLYDTFVYFFGDDINFEDGLVDDNIEAFDEAELQKKVRKLVT